jgi:hypothetical protein
MADNDLLGATPSDVSDARAQSPREQVQVACLRMDFLGVVGSRLGHVKMHSRLALIQTVSISSQRCTLKPVASASPPGIDLLRRNSDMLLRYALLDG